jgi:hypothetical protein
MRENEFWGYVGHYPPGSLKGDDDHTIDGRCAAQKPSERAECAQRGEKGFQNQ